MKTRNRPLDLDAKRGQQERVLHSLRPMESMCPVRLLLVSLKARMHDVFPDVGCWTGRRKGVDCRRNYVVSTPIDDIIINAQACTAVYRSFEGLNIFDTRFCRRPGRPFSAEKLSHFSKTVAARQLAFAASACYNRIVNAKG
jgi:hypothetical protein